MEGADLPRARRRESIKRLLAARSVPFLSTATADVLPTTGAKLSTAGADLLSTTRADLLSTAGADLLPTLVDGQLAASFNGRQ